jgi:hypothetical protein
MKILQDVIGPMEKKIRELTEEQKQILKETRKEWEDLFFDNIKEGRGIDKAAFENGIEWFYKTIIKKEKPKIIYCDSWESCIIIIAILRGTRDFTVISPYVDRNLDSLIDYLYTTVTWKFVKLLMSEYGEESVVESVWTSVRSSFHTSVHNSINNSITKSAYHFSHVLLNNTVHIPFNDSVVESVMSSVKETVTVALKDSLDDFIRNFMQVSIAEAVMASVKKLYASYSVHYNVSHFRWMLFYDFLSKTGILKASLFQQYKYFLKSCPFVLYMYQEFIFAVQPPVHLALNAQGRLHSTEGPAVKFRDGSGYYSINGRSVPEWIFEEKDRITREKFLNEKNAETRAAIYEVLGHKKIMEMLGAETVHTSEITHANGDVETVELLKTRDRFPEIENQPFAWVKLTCPSTGTNYLLGVDPEYKNAAEAVASLSMFKENEYSFNFRT